MQPIYQEIFGGEEMNEPEQKRNEAHGKKEGILIDFFFLQEFEIDSHVGCVRNWAARWI